MNRSTTLIALFLAFATGSTRAQYTPPDGTGLEGIIVETYYVADENDAADMDGSSGGLHAGAVTYRVYADLKDGYELLTVGGFTDHPITFNTTTDFFNNEDRGEAWGDNLNDIHLDKNTVAIDSWLTVGAASDAHWGVLKSEDPDGSVDGLLFPNDGGSNGVPEGLLQNDAPLAGIPLTQADGLSDISTPPTISYVGVAPELFNTGGSSYSSDNFAWAVLGGVSSPLPGNKLLIGQFTTDGDLSFCLNLWLRIPDSLVCNDPNCHTILEYYGQLLESDTAGTAYSGDNKFTLPSLCFNSADLQVDCEGVPDGPALPGTACDDGNADTQNDVYANDCTCIGEDCLGVLGGNALPGQPCDDNDPSTVNDQWEPGCNCVGSVGVEEHHSAMVKVYPNPAREFLWLEITDATGGRGTVELLDALGHRVIRRDLGLVSGTRRDRLDLSGLAPAVYFVEVTINGRAQRERITVF